MLQRSRGLRGSTTQHRLTVGFLPFIGKDYCSFFIVVDIVTHVYISSAIVFPVIVFINLMIICFCLSFLLPLPSSLTSYLFSHSLSSQRMS